MRAATPMIRLLRVPLNKTEHASPKGMRLKGSLFTKVLASLFSIEQWLPRSVETPLLAMSPDILILD